MSNTGSSLNSNHRFAFDDLEFEAADQLTLGSDVQTATPNGSAGNLELGKASIAGDLGEFVYSRKDLQQLCRIPLTLSILSTLSCHIEELELSCTVGSPTTDKLKNPSADIKYPKIVQWQPKRLRDPSPTPVQRTRGGTANPTIDFSAVGGPAVNVGSVTQEDRYPIKSGWAVNSGRKRTFFPHDTVRFTANEDHHEGQGLNHDFKIEITVEHLGEPFYVDFKISVLTMNFPQIIRRLLKKPTVARRHFLPTF